MTWSSIKSRVLQTLLLPILLVQGNMVKKQAIQLPEAKGARKGFCGSGEDLSIVFLGDSSACGVGVDHLDDALSGSLLNLIKDEYSCDWSILAKSKIITRDLIKIIQNEADIKVDVAVICIGMNDITAGKHAESWMLELSELRSLLTEKFAAKKIIFSGIPPVRHLKQIPQPLHYVLSLKASVFESALQEFCVSQTNCRFVDIDLPVNEYTMAKDGFHPNKVFYSTWAARIKALL